MLGKSRGANNRAQAYTTRARVTRHKAHVKRKAFFKEMLHLAESNFSRCIDQPRENESRDKGPAI